MAVYHMGEHMTMHDHHWLPLHVTITPGIAYVSLQFAAAYHVMDMAFMA